MKVEKVLILASRMLNLPEEVQFCLAGVGENSFAQKEADALLHSFNVVENELAMDYLPLYAEDEIVTASGSVFYTVLTRKPVRILGVKDGNGNSLFYQVFPEYVKAQVGKVRIRYTYMPNEKTLYDQSDYHLQASERLLALGVAVEYCLSRGMFEDANVWDKKYKQALKSAYKGYPSVVLRTRRWA